MANKRHIIIGQVGEHIAANRYKRKGYRIVGMNYSRAWGELDVIAKKRDKYTFVEVKTVSVPNAEKALKDMNRFRPEENVHKRKRQRLIRIIETFLWDKREVSWSCDVAVVFLEIESRRAKMRIIENVMLSD